MNKRNLRMLLWPFAAALLLGGCSADQKQPETKGAQSQVQTAPASEKYPIDWCIVSGSTLGKMGDPVTYLYQGRTIKFCCKNCIRDFNKAPAAYLARLDSAAAGQIKQPSEEGG
ncbi:MAG: TRASH domain-containing protein [candidate division Zixibacteria bacterium]|nr:TRASH domain-containing protein [candidate division Zixibacteria bacterium]